MHRGEFWCIGVAFNLVHCMVLVPRTTQTIGLIYAHDFAYQLYPRESSMVVVRGRIW